MCGDGLMSRGDEPDVQSSTRQLFGRYLLLEASPAVTASVPWLQSLQSVPPLSSLNRVRSKFQAGQPSAAVCVRVAQVHVSCRISLARCQQCLNATLVMCGACFGLLLGGHEQAVYQPV